MGLGEFSSVNVVNLLLDCEPSKLVGGAKMSKFDRLSDFSEQLLDFPDDNPN